MKFVSNLESKRMNNQDITANLMGRPQTYDDTYLRKKVSCLSSTLIVTFLIAAAALGISVIILIKHEATAKTLPVLLRNQTENIAKLEADIIILKHQLEVNQKNSNPIADKTTDLKGTIDTKNEVGDESSGFVEDISMMDGGIPIDASQPNRETLFNNDFALTDKELEEVNGWSNSGDFNIDYDNSDINIDNIFPGISDDLDIQWEGSGVIFEEVSLDEGSGNFKECPNIPYAVPICPNGKVCYKGNPNCPVPICCDINLNIDRHHH